MDPVGAGLVDGDHFLAKPGEVGCQYRRGDEQRTHRFLQNRPGNRLVVQQRLAFIISSGGQAKLALLILEKDVATLCPGELQGGVEHGHEDFVEYPGGVQLARGFEEKRELLQVGRFLRNLDAGNLAQKLARGVRRGMRRIENDIGRIAGAKFHPVIALKFLPLDTFPIDEGAVLASLIDQKELAALQFDLRVVARDARVGDHQVFVHLAADGEGGPVENNILLFISLHKHERGEDAGTTGTARMMCDGAQSHGCEMGCVEVFRQTEKRRIDCRSRLLCRLAPSQGILCALRIKEGQGKDDYRQCEGRIEGCLPVPERGIVRNEPGHSQSDARDPGPD